MHQFDHDIRLEADDKLSFSGHISDNWSINDVPDGGYLAAIIANAMLQHSQKRSTPIITVNFLNRCEAGPARVIIEKMGVSRQFDRLQAQLHQNSKEKIRAFGTFAIENMECNVESYEVPEPEMASLATCVAVPAMPNFTLFNQLDIRLDPACVGWVSGKLSDRSEVKGWIKFKDNRPFDLFAILLFADSFPPAVLSSQGMVAWVPTLEYSVNIRNLPNSEWLKCSFRTRFITCGLLEEDGQIWDQRGNLVAISRQIAQYRLSAKDPIG